MLCHEVLDDEATLRRQELLKMSQEIASSGNRESINRTEQVHFGFHVKAARRYLKGALGNTNTFDDGVVGLIDRVSARIALLSPRKLLSQSTMGGARPVMDCCNDLQVAQKNCEKELVENAKNLSRSIAFLCSTMCRAVEVLRQ